MAALNIVTEDECCGPRLGDVLQDNPEFPSPWICPECGQEWRSQMHKIEAGEGMRHWIPHWSVLVW